MDHTNKNAKPRTLTLEGRRATISYEPQEGRMPYRVRWFEDGRDRSEMFESFHLARVHAWAKLKALASGERTLSRQEFQDLVAFKSKFEEFESMLQATGRSLDSAISDVVTACEILPGWLPTQMAEFLVENHFIKNPMTTSEVKRAFMKNRRSGKERDFEPKVLAHNENMLGDFCVAFQSHIHLIQEPEVLRFIMTYMVGPGGVKRSAAKHLRPASGVLYLRRCCSTVELRAILRGVWPLLSAAEAQLLILNGIWSRVPEIRGKIPELAKRHNVLIADDFGNAVPRLRDWPEINASLIRVQLADEEGGRLRFRIQGHARKLISEIPNKAGPIQDAP